jgi:hypothetical protein
MKHDLRKSLNNATNMDSDAKKWRKKALKYEK